MGDWEDSRKSSMCQSVARVKVKLVQLKILSVLGERKREGWRREREEGTGASGVEEGRAAARMGVDSGPVAGAHNSFSHLVRPWKAPEVDGVRRGC